jgi:peptidoglycan/LPS O-acetylase OafA/YrhL
MGKQIEVDNYYLTVIRGLCVLMVVLSHLNPSDLSSINFKFGNIGVIGFFTLSSYLICSKLFRNNFSYYKFMKKRFIRIYPLFLFNIIFFVIIINLLFYTRSFKLTNWNYFDLEEWLILFANYTFNVEQWNTPFSHLWSICVEMHFYFLIPLVAKLSRKNRNLILTIGAIFPLILNFYIAQNLEYPSVWVQTTSHLSSFAFGALIANNQDKILVFNNWLMRFILIFQVGMLYYLSSFPTFFSGRWAGFSYLFSSLLFAVLIQIALVSSSKRFRFLHHFGKISYSVYLIHFPFILVFITFFELSNGLSVYQSAICFVGIWLLSLTYFKFLEKPILNSKSKIDINY